MKRLSLIGKGILAGALVVGGGLSAVAVSTAGAAPGVILITGHAGTTPVTLGTPQPTGSAEVSPTYSAYNSANGDIAFVSGDQVFLIPHTTEGNVYDVETASSPVAHSTLTAGDDYLVAGKTTADIVFQPGVTGNPTGSSSALASTNTLAPTSVAFDSAGNLLIGEKTTTHDRTAVQLIPKANCSTGCLYGISTYTAGHLYTLAGSGNSQPLPSYAIGYTYAIFANGLVVDGSASDNIIASTNGAVVFLNEGTSTVPRYGQTLLAKAATTIAGTASASAGKCTAATDTAIGSTAPKIAGTPKVALDSAGDLFVADNTTGTNHDCVWELAASQTAPAKVVRVTGGTTTGAAATGTVAAGHLIASVQGISVDLSGNLVLATASGSPALWIVAMHTGTFYTKAMTKKHAYKLSVAVTAASSLVLATAGSFLLTAGASASASNLDKLTGGPTAAWTTNTTITLSASPHTSTAFSGSTVAITATLNPLAAMGTVNFYTTESTQVKLNTSAVTVTSGHATFHTTALAIGPHKLTAQFTTATSTTYSNATTATFLSYTVHSATTHVTPVLQPFQVTVHAGHLTLSCTNAVTTESSAVKTCALIQLGGSTGITLNGHQQSVTGAMNPVYVNTDRGNPTHGWSLTAQMIPSSTTLNSNATCTTTGGGYAGFCDATYGAHVNESLRHHGEIPASDLSVAGLACTQQVTTVAVTDPNPTNVNSAGGSLGSELVLCSGSAGTSGGIFKLGTGTYTLKIPATVYRGTYYGTVEYLLTSV